MPDVPADVRHVPCADKWKRDGESERERDAEARIEISLASRASDENRL